ncbi:MAG: hypothetical protein A3B37_03900 [Candidatus Sungbacteria bacterium RIFCSPLOWO2_01_FULL_59_16]|uniref:EfeO-type cupredoxin-like domain-containing protein n=1 Tax=Candidatus Sungbacteria bacterium RIFCSPLOWO2_01_FULL_59_16 TaxID=1802280 RepID=A0A1G2LEM8_9BACT|nr:MAG: hypothetical protein A3B37_03900 [Candidatus Sungbacteria bacterium RIFCSPLOWO2_01_FULL_59_16]
MNKNILLITIVAVAAIAIVSYLLSQPLLPLEKPLPIPPATPPSDSETPAPTPPSPTPTPSPTGAPQGKIYRIIMDNKGFTPTRITVKAGDTVVFDNRDTRDRWPASDLHPTHLLCLGFDAQGGIAPGSSYAYAFPEATTCTLHDHLFPKFVGAITVEP